MKIANIRTTLKLFLAEMLSVSTGKIADFSMLMDFSRMVASMKYLNRIPGSLHNSIIIRVTLTNSPDIVTLFSKIIASTEPAAITHII